MTSEIQIKEEQVSLLRKELTATKEEIKSISKDLAKVTEYQSKVDETEYQELVEFRNFVVQEYETQNRKLAESSGI